jgi:hypothetical protein
MANKGISIGTYCSPYASTQLFLSITDASAGLFYQRLTPIKLLECLKVLLAEEPIMLAPKA